MKRFGMLLMCVAVASVTLVGCGGGGPADTYEGEPRAAVTGTVTLDGAQLESGTISFIPTDPSLRRASGVIAAGTYTITEGQGPNLGTYRVEISAWDDPPEGEEEGGDPEEEDEEAASQASPPNRVPAEFNTESTLEREIVAGENTLDFDL